MPDAIVTRPWAPVLAIALLAYAPLMFLSTLFWDDWTWWWVYVAQGARQLQEYMWQCAHPGYAPVWNLFLVLGGDSPGRLARAAALACHLASGWLIWRIFSDGSRAFAMTLAVAFLLSPYFLVRGSLAHDQYDVFILFYLLSIWLSGLSRPHWIAPALLAALAGLSIEPLAALEPVRWWRLYRQGRSRKDILWRALPFAALVLAVLFSRLTWIVPYGHYEGYNALRFDFLQWPGLARDNIAFFWETLRPAVAAAYRFLRFENLALVILLVSAAAAVGFARLRIGGEPQRRQIYPLAALGALVLILGITPYVMLGQAPSANGFSSRFVVASQMGALIVLVAALHLLPNARLRAGALGVIAFVFAANQFQAGKWLLYEEQVMRDFRRDAGTYLSTHAPAVFFVSFEPRGSASFYRHRCLSPNDMNVALDLSGKRNGSYLYDRECISPGDLIVRSNQCTVSGLDFGPCPGVPRQVVFRFNAGMDEYRRFSLVRLALAAMSDTPLDAGVLAPAADEPGREARAASQRSST